MGAQAERALAHNLRFAVALRMLAVARVKLGQQDRAGKAVELPETEPALTISSLIAANSFCERLAWQCRQRGLQVLGRVSQAPGYG